MDDEQGLEGKKRDTISQQPNLATAITYLLIRALFIMFRLGDISRVVRVSPVSSRPDQGGIYGGCVAKGEEGLD